MESKIVVFDSGVGGLSIWQAIKARVPHLSCDYILDNDYFPYGELPESVLIERVCQLVLPRIEYPPLLIVIACNTASTLVLDRLRAETHIPVVGVVPAIKPAAQISKTRNIGLLATPATVKRSYTQKLIEQFAPDCQVIKVGTSELVHMAEARLAGDEIDTGELTKILKPFAAQVDCIVLGCTHFPFLRNEIQALVGDKVHLIDTGDAIARRVFSLLGNNGVMPCVRNSESVLGYTRHTHRISRQLKQIKVMGFERVEQLESKKRQ